MIMSQSKSGFSLKKIIVSTDGSENAKRAFEAACLLAKQNGSELLVVHVVSEALPAQYAPIGINEPVADYTAYFNSVEQKGKELVNATVSEAQKAGVNATGEVLRTIASPVEAILEASDRYHANLIVVGTRGLGGFKKLFLGSVSNGIVSHATCSVLVVR